VSDAQGAYVLNPAPNPVGSPGGIVSQIIVQGRPELTRDLGESTGGVPALKLAAAEATTLSQPSPAASVVPETSVSETTADEILAGWFQPSLDLVRSWLSEGESDRSALPLIASDMAPVFSHEDDPLRSGLKDGEGSVGRDFTPNLSIDSGLDPMILIPWFNHRFSELHSGPESVNLAADSLRAAAVRWDDYFAQVALASE
jgi:hypothetical protein